MGLTRLAAARRECWQIPRMFSGLVSQRPESEPADAGWEATRRHSSARCSFRSPEATGVSHGGQRTLCGFYSCHNRPPFIPPSFSGTNSPPTLPPRA